MSNYQPTSSFVPKFHYLPESSSSSSSLSAFLAALPFLTAGVPLAGVAFFTALGGGACRFKEIILSYFINMQSRNTILETKRHDKLKYTVPLPLPRCFPPHLIPPPHL